ncbi:uncharacterized protein LOC130987892 isoform X2 [Salvia miltiorrhiza]|uniref:uncharacterized protein LOC130987892 isoform X2 n=1 Tax=Salvia miltiorrhiza TaxID=226208 RepID=UPI0025ABB03C|nr:uncharacterized protein LOC130987892 isoform X2 [Salvia miltiorrhiza]
MAFRGGGRGGRGRGRGRGPPRANELAFDYFPEIECLGAVNYTKEEVRKYSQFVNWSQNLQTFFETSPYHYEDKSLTLEKVQKVDIARFSDKKSQETTVEQPLWHLIMMDKDHMPAELARGEKRIVRRVQWDKDIDLNKLDHFEKLEENSKGKEGEDEEEEPEEEENIEDGELSDDDYVKGEYCDDDEDDFNMAEEDDEPIY